MTGFGETLTQAVNQTAQNCNQFWSNLFSKPPVPPVITPPTPAPAPTAPSPAGPSPSAPETSPRPQARPTQAAEEAADELGDDRELEKTCQECSECEIVTADMLKKIFTRAPNARLAAIAEGVKFNINVGKLDTELRLTHFFGQIVVETGAYAKLEEGLNYSVDGLIGTFGFYKRNPKMAHLHGRRSGQSTDQEAIANHAYANKIGNGDIKSGDGWLFRGRGLKQLTGRYNYRDFSIKHKEIWGGDLDFEADPDLLLEPKYAVQSALYYWINSDFFVIADERSKNSVTDKITKKINPGAFKNSFNIRNMVEPRRVMVGCIYSDRIFKNVCFNTSTILSNKEAEFPK